MPTYKPEDIVENIKCIIRGQETTPMHPWFRGFTGEIAPKGKDKYQVHCPPRHITTHITTLSSSPYTH